MQPATHTQYTHEQCLKKITERKRGNITMTILKLELFEVLDKVLVEMKGSVKVG